MKILFVTAEVAPFSKVGGLGDVSAALPRALHARGHEMLVVSPLYRRAKERGEGFQTVPGLENLTAKIGPHEAQFSVVTTRLPNTTLPLYFIDCPALYDREAVYTQDEDEHLRFIFLCWAALITCQHMGFSPDIAHANDWQAALLPLILRARFSWDKARFGRTQTVLTIHNMLHQGGFSSKVLPDTGLSGAVHLFHQDQLKAGVVNFMLTGILYAGAVTTVSPTYAQEIQTEGQGGGLHTYLRARSSTVVGILNGIDPQEWSPDLDTHIPHRYNGGFMAPKELNKKALLAHMDLPYHPEVPVAGVVTRLTWQKGLELILQAVPQFLAQNRMQLVVLGSGASTYENQFRELQARFPYHVGFYRGFSNPLAHLIEAGADMFLMPSRYEPCGLNQMYSLAYGTVPIVRKTGGLADTVTNFNPRTGRGNGFVFDHFTANGLKWSIQQALRVWPNKKLWRHLQLNGMKMDLSWNRQVRVYEALYGRLLAKKD